ncbi:IBR finger domain-containing protein [Colletotrichum scovillei]|uniref:RBR-type E3 ubiquitin transferase n=2 Tax=Colletotrichum scovillei TaxID=1209932 RepID=A0A9P7R620_9PEZI|nr:IBR finger domain-containing protein [Colletotrichum scovillei]KAG7065560.1 IBR finger domain-containing protein [Colletotrichum scovillei]KAG7068160.1 IBR finger domain-containing protein [Colletotrichum scovillei]
MHSIINRLASRVFSLDLELAYFELEPIEVHESLKGGCFLVLLAVFVWCKLMSIPETAPKPPMLCYEIDDESLRLVLQMQLEDLEDIKESSKGKCRVDEISDLDLAVDAYHAELESQAVLAAAADRCMCKSMAKANQSDGLLITILTKQENQATRDREAAIRLSNGATLGEDVSSTNLPVSSDESSANAEDEMFLRKLASLYVSVDYGEEENDDDDDDEEEPESSSWAASRKQPDAVAIRPTRREKKTTCDSCKDAYHPIAVAQLPCKHNYCRDCLRTLFELSLTDESLFPPRCCKLPIPVDGGYASVLLPPKLVGEFRAKEVEFSTPNRTYCHRPTCSKFIPKEFIRADVGTCPQCQQQTCTMCKGAEHGNQDCAHDTLMQALLEVAATNKWQRCFSCRRIVELNHGCYHITCPCGSEFCYLCSLRWKTCTCELWNEERLYARANVLVNREAGAIDLNAAARARRVEREARNLVAHHECLHDTWMRRNGSFRCEECRDRLPEYIYECAQCRIHACHRCRHNQL